MCKAVRDKSVQPSSVVDEWTIHGFGQHHLGDRGAHDRVELSKPIILSIQIPINIPINKWHLVNDLDY